jgi:type II secretory pathway pseudopilin PulG
MKKKSSFTLIETIMVAIILGILVSVGIPLYRKAVLSAEDKEAKAMLKLIQSAERMKKLETGNYISCTNISDCNIKLGLDLSTSPWNYFVTSTDPATNFCAQAQGAGTGNWYINQSDEEADQNGC